MIYRHQLKCHNRKIGNDPDMFRWPGYCYMTVPTTVWRRPECLSLCRTYNQNHIHAPNMRFRCKFHFLDGNFQVKKDFHFVSSHLLSQRYCEHGCCLQIFGSFTQFSQSLEHGFVEHAPAWKKVKRIQKSNYGHISSTYLYICNETSNIDLVLHMWQFRNLQLVLARRKLGKLELIIRK